ncbi:N6-adenosine-methyltransferase subunit mettl14 [Geranomyces variabilis]|nr:N6-adenosine-methyltransferase subunit mettl14 [Geranomyces variabilis]
MLGQGSLAAQDPLTKQHASLLAVIRARQKGRMTDMLAIQKRFGLERTFAPLLEKLEREERHIEDEVLQEQGKQPPNAKHHVNTGARPQNFIREPELADRYAEHPKLANLARLKRIAVTEYSTPPIYLHANLRETPLGRLLNGMRFDVILVDPPLKDVAQKGTPFWTWEEIANLRIEEVAATPSFIFVWVGNQEGLDRGRELLYKWGFRRCEDISWIKTNRKSEGTRLISPPSVLQQTKEHCLMGIKGTVRRATDGHFIHCNVDTDVIIAEEPADLSTRKPEELYHLIERFCMGRRRLELFGNDESIRPGWVTVGLGVSTSNWDKERYSAFFRQQQQVPHQGPDAHVKSGPLVITSPGRRPPTKRVFFVRARSTDRFGVSRM